MLEELRVLNRYSETLESDYSIKLDIKYSNQDFDALSAIMEKCRQDGIRASLEIYSEDGSRLIRDGNTVDETIDKIVGKFRENHDEIREIVAKASFHLPNEKMRLQKQLINLLSGKRLNFRIQFFIYKYSISDQLSRRYELPDGCKVHLWLSEAKLTERDVDSFFNLLWSDDYPIFLLPEARNVKLNFALVVNDLSVADKNSLVDSIETRKIFLRIKDNIGGHPEGRKLMVHLALLAKDSNGESFMRKIDSDLHLKDISSMPFPESHYLSFKEKWDGDHAKEAAAFANACGGLIVVGVNDRTGSVVGVRFDSRTVDNISDSLNSIKPPPVYDIWPLDYNTRKLIFIFVHKENGNRIFRLQKGDQPVKTGSVISYILDNDEVLRLRKSC